MKKINLGLSGILTGLILLFSLGSYAQSLSVTVSVTNITCNGANNGVATANITGGTPPYTYIWSNGATTSSISGLGTGTYVVYVNDANNDGGASTVTTFAGSTSSGSANGTGTAAKFYQPRGVVSDGLGNLYVADAANNEIRKIVISTGVVTTLAGSTTAGSADGTGSAAGFNNPSGMVYDGSGNLYVADKGNNEIRKIAVSTGAVTTFAGSTTSGNTNATGTAARFSSPYDLVMDGSGNLYVTDFLNEQIRKIVISTAAVTTFAGSNSTGSVNGTGTAAKFNEPAGITIDGSGNLYVADYANNEIRKIVISSAAVTTFAGSTTAGSANGVGTAASFSHPFGVVWDGGNNLYVADYSNNEIRAIAIPTLFVTTLAGTTTAGHANGTGSSATFNGPAGITIDGSGNLYIAEFANNDIRKIVPSANTISGSGTITQPSALSASSSAGSISCFGGTTTVTVSATGGTAPYSGTGTFTVGAGAYSYTVTDAKGCSSTTTGNVSQPSAALSASSSAGSISCFGGTTTVTVSATGGTAPYSGTGTFTVGAGAYSYTVTDANGCSSTTTGNVSQPSAALSASSSAGSISCFGGTTTVTVSATGGTAPYSGTGTFTVGAGAYSYTVTDANGCSSTTTGNVSQPSAALSASSSAGSISCFGGTTTVTVSATGGTAPYSGTGTFTVGAGAYSYTVTDANGCSSTTTGNVSQPSAALSASSSAGSISCFGGTTTVTVSATGGTAPYSGTGTFTVGAGAYSYTVTDANGCSSTTTGNVSQPSAALSASSSAGSISCFGGTTTVTVSATGGTAPYSGTGTFTVGAGAYSYTVTDANGCSSTTTGNVSQPSAALSASSSAGSISCFGGTTTVTVSATGGTAPYSGTGTFTVGAGAYSYTVTDANGCSSTTTGNVSQPSAALSASSSAGSISCFGGTTTVTVSATGGTAPYSGTGTFTVGAGAYSYTVTDANGCSSTTTGNVSQPASPLSASGSSTNVSCNGGNNGTVSVTASGGTSPYSYLWSDGATSSNVGVLTAGTYSVMVTDANGCSFNVTGIVVSQPAALTASITSSSNASCDACTDGSATVTASNGTPSYSYLWSDGETTSSVNDLSPGFYSCTVSDLCTSVVDTITIGSNTAALALTNTMTNVSCNGGSNGSITFIPSGGTPPYDIWYYSYQTSSWTELGTATVATGLSAGQYLGYVGDTSGDEAYTGTITITQPDALTASITSETDVTCNGGNNGMATITAGGGTPGYTYSWSNGETASSVSDLVAGTYTVVVSDANSCGPDTVTVTINQPNPIVAYGSETDASCYGNSDGSLSVSPVGGTSPYNYSWNGGATTTSAGLTGLSAGIYSLAINDANGCSFDTTFTVNQPALLTLSTSSVTNASCFGSCNGSATVSANGGTGHSYVGYTYNWQPTGGSSATANGLCAGTYTVTVTDLHGCTAIDTLTIGQPAQLIAAITSETDVTCNGGSNGASTITANGGTPAYTYTWSDGETTSSVSDLAAGTYTVIVNDANGCGPDTATVTVNQPNALSASVSGSNASCPSCSDGSATVTTNNGTPPYSYSWSDGETTSSVNDLSPGFYSVTVTDACTSITDTVTIGSNGTGVFTLNYTTSTDNCYSGGSITLTESNGVGPYYFEYYSSNVGYWQYAPGGYYTNSTSVTITGLSTGYYEGYVYDNSTGQSLYTAYFYFSDNAPAAPGMCYVTVDTAKEHNVVYWANNGNDYVLSTINIYKEGVSGYYQVGSISPASPSFTDTTSHSDVESNYYYVTGTDSCGIQSGESNINQTVLLQANLGVGGVVNLSWNAAQVTSSVDYYVIMRDTGTGFHNYDSVPFNIYAYTDLKPTNGPLQYMVNTIFSSLTCTGATSSRSNKKVINVTGINEVSNSLSSITVYPNPVKDEVTISIPTPTEGVISMTDVLGQQIYSTKLENNETTKQIDMTNLAQGVYMIKITSGDKQIVKRIVKL